VAGTAQLIITGAFTLAGALGGSFLTQQHGLLLAVRAETEARRTAVRSELATLIVEIRAMLDSAEIMTLIRRRPKPPQPRPRTRRDPYSPVKQHRIEDDRPDNE
jgi:hypothetical protein